MPKISALPALATAATNGDLLALVNGGITKKMTLEQLGEFIDVTTDNLIFSGVWNASTNTPTLTSSVGIANQFYIVSVTGTTNLNGITNWQSADWALFNGSVWTRIDATVSTSASTATAIVRRNNAGIANFSTLNIDGATSPALNIGATSAFNIGTATGNNQFFNGTVNGDKCIRNGDTARQLLLGVGAANAQFAVQNTVVQSNITHRFPYAGANRMYYSNGTNDLTASANYTVNGTGGLTITQGFTAATGTFSGINGVTVNGTSPSILVGTNTQYASPTANNQFFNPSLTNDNCIKNSSTASFVRIGVGSAAAQLIVGNTEVDFNVGVRLPTTGGTQSALNYYEEGFSFVSTFTGPNSVNVGMTITRINNKVFITFPDVNDTAGANATMTAVTNLPTRFIPSVTRGTVVSGINANLNTSVKIQVNNLGTIFIAAMNGTTSTFGNFINGFTYGIDSCTFIYEL